MKLGRKILYCYVFVGLACAPLSTAFAIPVTDGLVGYWPGENSAADASGNGHDGTLIGGSFTAGVVGSAFNLRGDGNFVEVPDDAAWAFGTNDFTISFFANVHSTARTYPVDIGHPSNVFIGQDEGNGNTDKWFVGLGDGTISIHVNNPSTASSEFLADAAFPDTLDEWHHVVVRRTGDLFETFIDGSIAGAETSSISIPDVAHPLRLGESEGFELDGFLDEVAIYDRALVDDEISLLGQPLDEAVPVFQETIDSGPGIGSFNRPFEVTFTFDNTPLPTSDGILTVDAFGDLNGLGESVLVFAETSSDEFLGELFNPPPVPEEPIGLIDTLTIPQSLLADFAADGSISLSMVVPSDNGASFVQFNSVRLQYGIASVPEPAALALLGIGLAGLGFIRRRKAA